MITLKKLAKELKVSISTVSKALRDSPEISSGTIEKVKFLANKYNYRPNKIALSLKSNRTLTIGVIIPDPTNTTAVKMNIINNSFSLKNKKPEIKRDITPKVIPKLFNSFLLNLIFFNSASISNLIQTHSSNLNHYLKVFVLILLINNYLGSNNPSLSS